MNISFYNGIKDIIGNKRSYSYLHYLNDIRVGKYKKEIETLRLEINKEKQKSLKNKLPNVTFAGIFKTRADKDLIKSSGLAILDFDDLENVIEKKEDFKNDKLVHSCFISPSGNGLKVLIKIPFVFDANEYKNIYNELAEKYIGLDLSCSNISRTCFLSYDEDLYLNNDSCIFEPNRDYIEPNKDFILSKSNIPIIDGSIIAERLLKWFKSKYDLNARNNSLYKLASAFNDFGVDKSTASMYLYQFEQQNFLKKEIDLILNSAYKKIENFGKKQFEDTEYKKKIQNEVLKGTPEKIIKEKFSQFENIDAEIKAINSKINYNIFWKKDQKGRVEIMPFRFKLFLEKMNFRKHYPNKKNPTFILIKKEGNFIDITSEFLIKDEVLKYLIEISEIEAFDLCADKLPIFTQKYLSMIDTAEVEVNKDDKDYANIYYKNLAIRVYHDKIEKIEYNDIKKDIWRTQIIDRDYNEVDHHDSQFRSFLWFACGEDVNKYNTMKSVIGYLLHGYKTSANNRAMILNDETISDNPNGRSGKGIIINAISQMKKTSVIDGKNFDFNKSFAFQTVNTDTQILAFDDVKKNFDFEKLFSVITEGITIEYKGKDAIKIPIKESPKIIISTNYTVKSDGGSFEGRIFEVEMSNYFNSKNTPLDKFGNLLFEDWSNQEWCRFDKFMINCLQYYLANGLVKSETKNLELRKFINETSQEFYEFSIIDRQIKHNERLDKRDFYEKFMYEYPDYKKWLKTNTFTKWLKKYSDYFKYNLTNGNSNGQRWVMIEDFNNLKESENIDMPF